MLPKIDMPTFKVKMITADQELTMRPMTVKQTKILMIGREAKTQRDMLLALTSVLNQCIIEPVDTAQMPEVEIGWLYIKLRAGSVSNKVSFSIRENDKSVPVETLLDDVTVKHQEDRKDTINPTGNVVIKLRETPVSVLMSEEFSQLVEKEDEAGVWRLLFLHSIDEIVTTEKTLDGKTMGKKELDEWLESLPGKAFAEFQEYAAKKPTLHHIVKYKVGTEDREFVLSSLSDFFLL